MPTNPVMNAMDAVSGSLATCFLTVRGRRLNFMQLTEFESKWEISIADVPILGKIGMGHKPSGGKGSWSGKAHFNQSQMREIADEYQKTGRIPYFEIQVTNEDPTSSVGRQTVIHRGCLFDTIVLSKFQAGEEILEEDLSGTFEDWDLPEKFRDLPGI